MRVTAYEVLKKIAQPRLVENDLRDVKFELQQLQSAVSSGNMELAMNAAKGLAEAANFLASSIRTMLPGFDPDYDGYL